MDIELLDKCSPKLSMPTEEKGTNVERQQETFHFRANQSKLSTAFSEMTGQSQQNQYCSPKNQFLISKARTDLLLRVSPRDASAVAVVGPFKKHFKLQQVTWESQSAFFKAALRVNRFREGREGRNYLPEEEPEIFRSLVWWMHHGQLVVPERCWDAKERPSQQDLAAACRAFCQLWISADQLLIRNLGKEVVFQLRKTFNMAKPHAAISPDTVLEVWDRTCEHDALRNLIASELSKASERLGEDNMSAYAVCLEELPDLRRMVRCYQHTVPRLIGRKRLKF